MSQQIPVSRDIVFRGAADYTRNVKGNFMTEKVYYDNHFVEDNNTSYQWTEGHDSSSSTWSHSATAGGAMICTTSGSDTDLGEFTNNVIWSCAKNCTMEARVKLSSIADIVIVVGFADAAHANSNELAAEMTSAALVATRGTEVAVLIHDTNSSVDKFYYGAYKLGVIGTPVVTAIAPSTSYQNLRVAMNTTGGATFYINGVRVGFLPTCVTSTVLLTPMVAFMARTGSEKIGYIDRTTMWQDE